MGKKCVYCGVSGDLTVDHIPPKTIFPKPRPINLITVPSCYQCNQNASMDDEYFRLNIAFRHDTGDHPDVKKILPSVFRSLEKPEKRGFQKSFFNSMGYIEVLSEEGANLGKIPGYKVDNRRLDNVAARIIRGLYFHHFHQVLPSSARVVAYSFEGINNAEFKGKEKMASIVSDILKRSPFTVGNKVFEYWFQQIQNFESASIWVLSFFEFVVFIGFVFPTHNISELDSKNVVS